MNESLIADIWTLILEVLPEKHKENLSTEYVTLLLDNGISESTMTKLLGVDPYLDGAINSVIIDEDEDDEED
jgi:hypothetical protein